MSSDYGSDINLDDAEDILNILDGNINDNSTHDPTPSLTNFPHRSREKTSVAIANDDPPTIINDTGISSPRNVVLVPVSQGDSVKEDDEGPVLYPKLTVEKDDTFVMRYPDLGGYADDDGKLDFTSAPPIPMPRRVAEAQPEMQPADQPTLPDGDHRSPFERFRSQRKTLSVTDLVSGVWCEQKFKYTLERGFQQTTPAMKKGTQVHKALEEQIHTTVQVEVTTREDQWGLKLFNMCQGLQSLRYGGLTRELSVFGFLNGIFISGIIDEISYTNPGVPEILQISDSDSEGGVPLPIDLTGSPPDPTPDHPLVAYVSDTKTRSTQTIPGGSQLRATVLQLMIYHHLLAGLRAGSVDFAKVLENFDLDGSKSFSDGFLSQVGSLNSAISLEEMLAKKSLWGFWGILQRQLSENIDTVGDTLAVNYRSQRYGDIMDTKTFEYDEAFLTAHMNHTVDWWEGKRPAVGVEIEEAWKCGKCEFREDCTWRLDKIEELKAKNEAKKNKRERSTSPRKKKKV